MFKFLVLIVLIWRSLPNGASAEKQEFDGLTDTATPILTALLTPRVTDTNKQTILEPNGRYSFHATHQTFYLNGPVVMSNPTDSKFADKAVRSDYKVTKGLGAHKLHHRKLSWNRARRTCHEEGGHLAIIRSDEEEKVIQQMMHQEKIGTAWIGFHDTFEEGDWVSVLDEPMNGIGWSAWAKLGHGNPDNAGGKENCAEYRRDADGINDAGCNAEIPFVCKIPIP